MDEIRRKFLDMHHCDSCPHSTHCSLEITIKYLKDHYPGEEDVGYNKELKNADEISAVVVDDCIATANRKMTAVIAALAMPGMPEVKNALIELLLKVAFRGYTLGLFAGKGADVSKMTIETPPDIKEMMEKDKFDPQEMMNTLNHIFGDDMTIIDMTGDGPVRRTKKEDKKN